MGLSIMMGPRLRTVLLFSLIQALTLYPLLAVAIRHRVESRPNHAASAAGETIQKRADSQCTGFPGDQDTYGLGIRIGLYFQWMTSSLAYNLVPTEAVTMRGVNNCFQTAMFAGLIYITVTKAADNQLHAVEAYLMLLFCMGGVCSGTVDTDEEDEGQIFALGRVRQKGFAFLDASTLGGYVRLLLGCGFISYGLWFVFVGMDSMLQPGFCTYAFFFARVNLAGWFRTLLKVLFILAAIPAYGSMIYGTNFLVGEGYRFFFRSGWQGRVKPPRTPSPGDPDEEEEKPGFHPKFQRGNFGFSGALILFIIAVELTIRWNKIEGVQDVGSTGQLLPVIIGVGGVGRVLMKLVTDMLEQVAIESNNRRKRTTSFSGTHGFAGAGGAQGPGQGQTKTKIPNLQTQPTLPFVHDTDAVLLAGKTL